MQHVLVTTAIADLEQFLEVFRTRGLALRQGHGSQGAQVLPHADDPHRVSLLFAWEHDAFRAFLADPEVKASMAAGGSQGPPDVVLLGEPVVLDA